MKLFIKLVKKVAGFFLNVEWEADEEIVVLFGPSGAGKSITLKLIAGLMEPDEVSSSLAAISFMIVKEK